MPDLRRLSRSFCVLRTAFSSRSRRRVFSLSSLRSRSARLAVSCEVESAACSSSIFWSKRSTLSRDLFRSSWVFCKDFSRRSSCDCRSLTVRSTLRTLRASFVRVCSRVSSWFSSCTIVSMRSENYGEDRDGSPLGSCRAKIARLGFRSSNPWSLNRCS